jgi:hypothetical protein
MSSADPSSTSTTPPCPAPSTYATVSLHKSDVLRLLNFPPDLPTALAPIILAAWPPGLQSHNDNASDHSSEFKFKGRPFGSSRAQHYVGSVRMMRDVVAFLYARGWDLVTAAMCSRRYTAKDTLIFRQRAAAAAPPPAVEWLALAPMATCWSDKLRVVYDAAGVGVRLFGGVDGAQDHLGLLITAIKNTLQGLECFKKGGWSHDSFEFELKGRPWRSRGEASVKMRIMLARVLETMEAHGWRLYTSFVLRTGSDEERILDTWFFVREKGTES